MGSGFYRLNLPMTNTAAPQKRFPNTSKVNCKIMNTTTPPAEQPNPPTITDLILQNAEIALKNSLILYQGYRQILHELDTSKDVNRQTIRNIIVNNLDLLSSPITS